MLHLHDQALVVPLRTLRASRALHDQAHDLRALSITQARIQGHSWRSIACALGCPVSTVQRRFAVLEPRRS